MEIRKTKRKDKFVFELIGVNHCSKGQNALYGVFSTLKEAKKELKKRK